VHELGRREGHGSRAVIRPKRAEVDPGLAGRALHRDLDASGVLLAANVDPVGSRPRGAALAP
jgi:hypothetical protein